MELHLFNTESKTKEIVRPRHDNTIRMYTCGPTIYNFAHIGNFRTYVFEDLLRRTIQFFGFKIDQAMNLTDIDDKTIRGAVQKGISLKEFTEPFRIAFFEDLKTLNIQPVEHYPPATAFIPQMLTIIETLLKKGIAYESNGSVYYSIKKFPSYGRLSHLCIDELMINASGDNNADEYEKDHLSDFVLWKAYDVERDGQIYWDSPYGKGRPGWHIECSAMAMDILGETIDIHCGGVDNMFPHHENEIAQSEGCSGHQFVHHWVHVEHLLVDHKKMSKSLGNFYTLRDLLKMGYTGPEVRYLLLSSHYRSQLNFTFPSLQAARASLQRIEDLIVRLRSIEVHAENQESVYDFIHKAERGFKEALADDINISEALACIFELVRELNTACDEKAVGKQEAHHALKLFEQWDTVLGVLPLHKKDEIPTELLEFLRKREEARKSKNYLVSDQMREAILTRGYLIEDTPTGARLKKKL
ncbi:MAG TPA: cysteine--tRNA ligase [Chlamydiales bacterium]|nr:cysteine--tRNA ligase [Chlamydiales bacterium]